MYFARLWWCIVIDALITNIQGYSIHDGPGIRTVVFFKGCGLRCKWCANPECISCRPQTGFIENLCTHCGKCEAACVNGAINTENEAHRIDYKHCTGCGMCADVCYYGALVRYGKKMSVEEVFDAVRRDKMFYADTGGVTASGGEPLMQADFVAVLFEMCKNDAISTCLETSGFAGPGVLLRMLPLTDHLLFDIKHMNGDRHKESTMQPNDSVLENARLAAESGADILFRMPLIPGENDGIENIEETARFLKQIQSGPALQLMPFHRLGDSKYKALDMPYPFREIGALPQQRIEEIRGHFDALGVDCSVSI